MKRFRRGATSEAKQQKRTAPEDDWDREPEPVPGAAPSEVPAPPESDEVAETVEVTEAGEVAETVEVTEAGEVAETVEV
ncbi:MAG TPA: hypothetical protein VEH29_01960, partial [Acidimicrobiales bacterium]|nr:hypothetical protein [Acidimicrobiales bacterium]